MRTLQFLIVEHFGLAMLAAVLFLAGGALALPAVRRGPALLTRLPLFLFARVRRLMGENPGLSRMVLVIFGFNGTAMFLYMASGYRPVIPMAIAFLTGYNIVAIMLLAGEEGRPTAAPDAASCRWLPSAPLTAVCGAAVLLLELPCFWYAIAMGVSLGRESLAGGGAGYAAGLALRAGVYTRLLLPALLASAVCEAVAIRGMQGRVSAVVGDS